MAIRTLPADVRPANIDGAPTHPLEPSTSRRAFFGAVGFALVAATGVPAVAALSSSTDIEQHWQNRARAYREFEADPLVLDNEIYAKPYWDRIDDAEEAILGSTDTSNRAIEIRLWTAWSHTDRALAEAITQGDVPALRRQYFAFDWHEKMLFSAILALRGEERAC